MRRVLVAAIIFLLLPSVSAQTHTLEVVPDHDPWITADVDRFAVRLGNCMTWTVWALNGTEPASEVAVLVTDSQGRETTVYTGTSGVVEVGTTQCWTTPRVVDHAFQVVGTLAGENASSDRVVHEVMWSAGQVFADVPADASGQVSIPVQVVWTATNEPMPVSRAVAVHDGQSFEIVLEDGVGVLQLSRASGTLQIGVPASDWLSGGPGATISVTAAGPFWNEQQNAPPPSGGGSPPPAQTPERQETGEAAAAEDGGDPSTGDADATEAQDDANPTDSTEAGAPGPGADDAAGTGPSPGTAGSAALQEEASKGVPALGVPLLAAALMLARRRA